MKRLNVFFDPERVPELNPADVVFHLRALSAGWAEKLHVDQGDDNGPYASVTYTVRDLADFWAHLQAEMSRNPIVSAALLCGGIITCEGDHSWDDYLLLHHFDLTEPLDTLASV
jgi:hypothetical protein